MGMLIPIYKVDEERRLVIGRAAQEVPDRAGEIMDYETAKPAFKAWSDETFAASGGKSYGNVRAMHGGIAAGRLDAIEFDDAAKSIEVVAHVVDDNEWKKVLEGVYTGFSMGGKYAKRWKDGDLTRYTPSVSEISLVDRPCVPSAQFADILKADGTIGKLALKGADMADENDADEVVKADEAEVVADPAAGIEAETEKADHFGELKKYLGEEVWDASRAMDALNILTNLLCTELCEAERGEDEPAEQFAALREAIARIKEFIVSEIQESHDKGAEETAEGETMEMADSGDLEKAGKAISSANGEHLAAMHKAASDIAMRCAKMMGMDEMTAETVKADEAEDLTKADGVDELAKMAGELDELRKAHDAVTAERDELLAKKAEWEAAPAPAKGATKVVTKADDNAGSDAVADLQARLEKMSPEEQAREVIKFQLSHGGKVMF